MFKIQPLISYTQKSLGKLGLTLLLCCLFVVAKAQRMDDGKLEQLKIQFLTEKMDLSQEEAKVFWPIYNGFSKEMRDLRKARMTQLISFRKVGEIDKLSDSQIQTLILNDFNFKQNELNIEKKYFRMLKSSLPIKTVGKFYRAQEAFKKELLNRFKGPRRD